MHPKNIKMKPSKFHYPNTKGKMKFGKQELPLLTNQYLYPGRDQINDKFNILVDHIWNIPKATNDNEQFIVSIKKCIIYALHNFVTTNNQGVPLLTKASPSGKGYTYFVLLTGPHKGIFISFADLCMAKEGIPNLRYKGFYTKDEVDKALELNTINPKEINEALNPEPEILVINPHRPSSRKSYKDIIPEKTQQELDFTKFLTLQTFMSKAHKDPKAVPGMYIKIHPYYNRRFACIKSSQYCTKPNKNCPCKLKFLFRKAKLDLEQFKPMIYEDLPINLKTLLDYACLDSVIIPPTERFTHFLPSINEAINLLQAELMSTIGLLISSCPSNYKPNGYSTHVIKLVTEDHKDFPILCNDTSENLDIQGNSTYQYNILRAQTMGQEWFFTETNTVEYNLLKETFDTKLYLPDNLGKMFIPFPIENNNKLVQFFQKERRNKDIYESSGGYGQGTPTNDFSMSETSENVEEDVEDVSVTSKGI
ncbi:hypothetical protein Fmac_017277 [Flemingia macrophylla]|uniref:Uncharacterized protein n=1 Tax=Flemingia macrophylla TaxID=520843 RepID=A0ABD1M1N0_9FABA